MISESYPWKQELRRLACLIRTETAKPIDIASMDERSEFKLERAIFYAAFVVRKLIENKKITDKVAGHSVEVKAFGSRRQKVGNVIFAMSTSCDLDKEYDLARPYRVRMSPSDLGGKIIHSHKLMWECADDGCILGMYLCSYRQAEDRLVLLPLELFCSVIKRVANDAVTQARLERVTKPSTKGTAESVAIKYVLK